MGKRFQSVSEMAADLMGDETIKERLEEQFARRSLAKMLFQIRCARGVTQQELAKEMGVTQGKISKLEHSDLETIKISDIAAYTEGLGIHYSIVFHTSSLAEPADRVKMFAHLLKQEFDAIAELAGDDSALVDATADFIGDQLVTIARAMSDTISKLPDPKKQTARVLERVFASVDPLPPHEEDEAEESRPQPQKTGRSSSRKQEGVATG